MNHVIYDNTSMHHRSEIGQSPTRYSVHPCGSHPVLLGGSSCSFLFVLQGELLCSWHSHKTITLKSAQLMALDTTQLSSIHCKGETILLECEASPRMERLISRVFNAFNIAHSDVLPLNAPLHAWCDALLAGLLEPSVRPPEYFLQQCSALTHLLLTCPQSMLGALYIPLFACSSQCDNCTKAAAT